MTGLDSVSSSAASGMVNQSTQTTQAKAKSDSKGSGSAASGEKAAVYEGSSPAASSTVSSNSGRIGAYASKAERDAMVLKLQEDEQARIGQLQSIVEQLMSKQGNAYGAANDMWQFLASGDFTVDAATKAQAQEDISEDGYWGVKQTSERIFDFAMALSGGDEETMRKMEAAFEKGFKQATSAWGKELPDISSQTYDATKKLFGDYYESLKASQESQNSTDTTNTTGVL